MIDAGSRLLTRLGLAQMGATDAFLLASSGIVTCAFVALLHAWADVPVMTAGLVVFGVLALGAAGNALVRRAGPPHVYSDEMAELRAEIAALQSARTPGPLSVPSVEVGAVLQRSDMRPSIGETSALRPRETYRQMPLLPAPAREVERAASPLAARPVAATIAPTRAAGRLAARPEPRPLRASPAARARPQSEPIAAWAGSSVQPSAQPSSQRAAPRMARENGLGARTGGSRPHDEMPSASPDSEVAEQTGYAAQRQALDHLPAASMPSEGSVQAPYEHDAMTAQSVEHAVAAVAAVPVPGWPRSRPASSFVLEPGSTEASADAVPALDVALLGHVTKLSEALEAKRLDVFLNPLVGLSERKARHLEISVRLATPSGTTYAEDDIRRIAAGSGLLARIDAAKLARAADILKRFRANGSRVRLFCPLAAETLIDENFSVASAELLDGALSREIGPGLAFSLCQAEARTFSSLHWQMISQLWMRGASFALTDVTDLDIDFELLKSHGFDFIKLDAAVFLDGLPTPGGRVPAADICRHLSSLGLNLILGETATE